MTGLTECQPGCAEAITLLSELADVIEAVRGDRDLLRVSGRVGDRQDVGVVGIDGFIRTVRQAVARVEELTKALEAAKALLVYAALEGPKVDAVNAQIDGALAPSLERSGGAT